MEHQQQVTSSTGQMTNYQVQDLGQLCKFDNNSCHWREKEVQVIIPKTLSPAWKQQMFSMLFFWVCFVWVFWVFLFLTFRDSLIKHFKIDWCITESFFVGDVERVTVMKLAQYLSANLVSKLKGKSDLLSAKPDPAA